VALVSVELALAAQFEGLDHSYLESGDTALEAASFVADIHTHSLVP
jgi:hypothetical protein